MLLLAQLTWILGTMSNFYQTETSKHNKTQCMFIEIELGNAF